MTQAESNSSGVVAEKDPRQILPVGQSYGQVGDRITATPLNPPGWKWMCLFGIGLAGSGILLLSIFWVVWYSVGVWGVNIPVAWGFAIINFVWWIGIGHAGTLISAFLLLMRQGWRTSINRFAEAMTLFAVMNAGLFPLLHLGKPWKFYYILPYPNTMNLWPQWRSALVFDVFAVATYFTVSLLFWYVGLVPDLASLRDTARKRWQRRLSGVFALGWRGAARHWQRHQMLYLLLAGLATPLVISVHSVVSIDFTIALVPGWHSTFFPPYFVAGAIFSGFAMVFTIAIPVRKYYGLEDMITLDHLNAMAKVTLVTAMILLWSYATEWFNAWFSAEEADWFMAVYREVGPYKPVFIITMIGNVLVPQLLWFRKVRRNPAWLFVIAQFINVGMWTERYMIIVTGLSRDYMTSSWGMYHGTIWDWLMLTGTLGFFLFMMLLFLRLVPMISIFEMRESLHHHQAVGEEEPVPPAEPEHDPEQDRDPPRPPLRREHLWGYLAEFKTPEALKAAAEKAFQGGYQKFEAYSPFPIKGINEGMGRKRSAMAAIVLIGGIVGAASGFGMQVYASMYAYPWNIGGRPYFSWQSFIPITFELGVLGASIFGFVGMLVLNGLPLLYHPLFNARGFERVTRDRFFLCIESEDPGFHADDTREFLEDQDPLRVSQVPK